MLFGNPNHTYILIAVCAYLIGSIPFGLIFGKLFRVGDIRQIGSGNIGATNALRTGNKAFAIAVLLGDGLKGVVAVIAALWYTGFDYPYAALIAGLAAVIGHVFPVWLKFRGGKGVATAGGVILILHWPTGLACIALWLITAKLSRFSSLGAIMAAIHAPIYALANGVPEFALPFAFLGLLLLWTHRENLRRLWRGGEARIAINK